MIVHTRHSSAILNQPPQQVGIQLYQSQLSWTPSPATHLYRRNPTSSDVEIPTLSGRTATLGSLLCCLITQCRYHPQHVRVSFTGTQTQPNLAPWTFRCLPEVLRSPFMLKPASALRYQLRRAMLLLNLKTPQASQGLPPKHTQCKYKTATPIL